MPGFGVLSHIGLVVRKSLVIIYASFAQPVDENKP